MSLIVRNKYNLLNEPAYRYLCEYCANEKKEPIHKSQANVIASFKYNISKTRSANKELEEENRALKEQLEKQQHELELLRSNNEYKTVTVNIKNNLEKFKEYYNFVFEFTKCIQSTYDYMKPTLFGSNVRKLFELANNVLIMIEGNTCHSFNGNNVDIAFSDRNNFDDDEVDLNTKNLNDFTTKLKNQLDAALLSENTSLIPKFSTYVLCDVVQVDHGLLVAQSVFLNNKKNIPCYQLVFKSTVDDKPLFVDLYAWLPVGQNIQADFSVNNLVMNNSAISALDGYNATDVIQDILNKRTICNYDFSNDNTSAFSRSITRSQKKILLTNLCYFLSERYIKIINDDYTIFTNNFSNMPKLRIETELDCVATLTKPPYPTLELECGHEISLIAYVSTIMKGQLVATEAIKCHICRTHDMKLRFINRIVTPSPIWKYQIDDLLKNKKQKLENVTTFNNKNISSETADHLVHSMKEYNIIDETQANIELEYNTDEDYASDEEVTSQASSPPKKESGAKLKKKPERFFNSELIYAKDQKSAHSTHIPAATRSYIPKPISDNNIEKLLGKRETILDNTIDDVKGKEKLNTDAIIELNMLNFSPSSPLHAPEKLPSSPIAKYKYVEEKEVEKKEVNKDDKGKDPIEYGDFTIAINNILPDTNITIEKDPSYMTDDELSRYLANSKVFR